MDLTSELIQTVQILVTSYNNTVLGIEKINNCSVLINSIHKSPTRNKAVSNLVDTFNLLHASRLDIENLLRHLYYSICGITTQDVSSFSIKDISSRILLTLTNLYSVQETPSYTSIDNSIDSPIRNPQQFSDSIIDNSFDINDTYLNDFSCPDPWQDTIGDYLFEDTVSSPNRIALPSQTFPITLSSLHENDTEKGVSGNQIDKKSTSLFRKKKKDDDDEYEGDMSDSKTDVKKEKIGKKDYESRKSTPKPKWCHQCKARKRDVVQCCGDGKIRGANNQICFRAYCSKCLKKHYGEDYNEIRKKNKKWLCPGCRDACSCAACVRKRYADPRDIPANLQTKRNSRFFKTNRRLIRQLTNEYHYFLQTRLQIKSKSIKSDIYISFEMYLCLFLK